MGNVRLILLSFRGPEIRRVCLFIDSEVKTVPDTVFRSRLVANPARHPHRHVFPLHGDQYFCGFALSKYIELLLHPLVELWKAVFGH